MGKLSQSAFSPIIPIGPTSSLLIAPDEVAQEIDNLYPSEHGGYRSILGVFPLVITTSGADIAPAGGNANGTESGTIAYGEVHGISHNKTMNGSRELLLVHVGNEIWHHKPMLGNYDVVLGPGSDALLQWRHMRQQADQLQEWPTQFIATPTGTIIIPETGRMFFYDGEVAAPLGYTSVPTAPTGLGPEDEYIEMDLGGIAVSEKFPNGAGYSHNGLWGRTAGYLDHHLGKGRIGTIEPLPDVPLAGGVPDPDGAGAEAGTLLSGSWRCKMAWIDRWGNVSEASEASAEVKASAQRSRGKDNASLVFWMNADYSRITLGWEGIGEGPPHTIGRILYRTKDLNNSGDTNFYYVPGTTGESGGLGAFATIPDGTTTFFPDNIPDGFLTTPERPIRQAPIARLGTLAFGRFWAANLLGDPGAILASHEGLYGTFDPRTLIRPDPTGSRITAIHTIPQGILVFTISSTFLVTINDSGDGFRIATLARDIGCVAPNSVATTRFGLTVWLGRDGFYAYDGQQIQYVFSEHRDWARRFNRAHWGLSNAVFNPESGQYECWVPMDSSRRPNRRWKFDGQSWHFDSYDGTINMTDTCVSADHRQVVIGCGQGKSGSGSARTGVWVLDRGLQVQTATYKTGWIRSLASDTKSTIRAVRLWFRETNSGTVSVKVRRNYRAEVIQTETLTPYPDIDTTTRWSYPQRTYTDVEKNPSLWGTATAGTTSYARRRRPYWETKSVEIPTCEVFQLEVTSSTEIEIVAIRYEWLASDLSAATSRRNN